MSREVERIQEAVAGGKSLQEVLSLVMEEARSLSGARSCSVVMIDAGRDELVFFATGGERGRPIEELRFPAGRGITGSVIQEDRAEFVNEPEKDPRFYRRIGETAGLKTENILVFPLKFEERVIGAIDLLNKPGGFDAVDLLSLLHLADAAGRALGESKRIADEIKSGQYLVGKFETTMDHLIRYNR